MGGVANGKRRPNYLSKRLVEAPMDVRFVPTRNPGPALQHEIFWAPFLFRVADRL
jgi:hypothetical protein